MSWLRYARMLLPVILQAAEIAARFSESKAVQRRFMKTWMHSVIDLAEAALIELEDKIDDIEEDTSAIEGED